MRFESVGCKENIASWLWVRYLAAYSMDILQIGIWLFFEKCGTEIFKN
jgi:hypothetical protein